MSRLVGKHVSVVLTETEFDGSGWIDGVIIGFDHGWIGIECDYSNERPIGDKQRHKIGYVNIEEVWLHPSQIRQICVIPDEE